jgi:hypothetical protein
MAKTNEADAEYQEGRWHLAQVLRVRWASLPGVGTDMPAALTFVIKLAIPYRWPAGATGTEPDVDLEFVNRAAVIYVPCTTDRRPLTSAASLFLGELGIGREATRDDLGYTCEWFKCEFGPPDSVYKFQPIVKWEPVDVAWALAVARRVLATVNSRPKPELKLDFPGPGRAIQNGTELDFTTCPIAWYVLRRLALRYDDPYRPVDLGIDAWAEAGLEPPDKKDSVYQAVSQLKKILGPSGLTLPRPTSRGYCLKITEDQRSSEEVTEPPQIPTIMIPPMPPPRPQC